MRELARSADNFTVDKLHTRIAVEHAPSGLRALIQSLNAMFSGLERSFQPLRYRQRLEANAIRLDLLPLLEAH